MRTILSILIALLLRDIIAAIGAKYSSMIKKKHGRFKWHDTYERIIDFSREKNTERFQVHHFWVTFWYDIDEGTRRRFYLLSWRDEIAERKYVKPFYYE